MYKNVNLTTRLLLVLKDAAILALDSADLSEPARWIAPIVTIESPGDAVAVVRGEAEAVFGVQLRRSEIDLKISLRQGATPADIEVDLFFIGLVESEEDLAPTRRYSAVAVFPLSALPENLDVGARMGIDLYRQEGRSCMAGKGFGCRPLPFG